MNISSQIVTFSMAVVFAAGFLDVNDVSAQDYGYISAGTSNAYYRPFDVVDFADAYALGEGTLSAPSMTGSATGSVVELGHQYDLGAGLSFGWSSGIAVMHPEQVLLSGDGSSLQVDVRYRDLYSNINASVKVGGLMVGGVMGSAHQNMRVSAIENGSPKGDLTGTYSAWAERLENGIRGTMLLGPVYFRMETMKRWATIRSGRLYDSNYVGVDALSGQYFPQDYEQFQTDGSRRRNAVKNDFRGRRYSLAVGLRF